MKAHGQLAASCILCRDAKVGEFLDLGATALANQFLRADEIDGTEAKYPLRVGFCHGCGHVQLTESVPPGAMFDNYLYISSASDTLKDHLWDLSDILVRRYRLGAQDLVIDIGCNDGTLLKGLQRHGVRLLGDAPGLQLELPDVVDAGAVRREVEPLAVAREDGVAVVPRPLREARAPARVGDLEPEELSVEPAELRGVDDAAAVRGVDRRSVVALVVGEVDDLAAREIEREDVEPAAPVAGERDLAAVG